MKPIRKTMKTDEMIKLKTKDGYQISSWSKSPNGCKGIAKSPIIWGHAKGNNCILPLAYLLKPKWMDADSWKIVVDAIELKMPETFLAKETQK